MVLTIPEQSIMLIIHLEGSIRMINFNGHMVDLIFEQNFRKEGALGLPFGCLEKIFQPLDGQTVEK